MANVFAAGHDHSIAALLADVDGALLSGGALFTARTIEVVERLRDRGVVFCITSNRPPRALRMLIEPLELTMAMAAFNGAVIVRPDLSVIDEKTLPVEMPAHVIDIMRAHRLEAWVYTTAHWFVTDLHGPRVEREAASVQFSPIVVPHYENLSHEVVKIVGVSTNHYAVSRCEASIQAEFGSRLTASRSQPYYLEVTHAEANTGAVVTRLARYLKVSPHRIATIGDQRHDTLMFKESGLSIAMANASAEVQRQATFVTTVVGDEGLANAVESFVLPRIHLSNALPLRAS
jgi:Cof subfamily protein (haloacid dehalogenase superfamily)